MSCRLFEGKLKLVAFGILLVLFMSQICIKPVDKEQEIIIILKGDSVATLAQKYNITLQDKSIKELTLDKLTELKRIIAGIQEKGIPLTIEGYLYMVVLGAIVRIPSRYIPIVSAFEEVSKLAESKLYRLHLENSVKMTDAERAWNLKDSLNNNVTGKGIKVAIIDTGVNYELKVMGGGFGPGFKVIGGYDFVDKDRDPMDIDGHGTAVAAIVAGKDEGQMGVAPEASILAYRAISESEMTSTSYIAEAVDKAVRDGADVINLSLGSFSDDDVLNTAISNAMKVGIVIVAAAGNSGPMKETIEYPSALNGVLSVGATSNLGSLSPKAEFSIDNDKMSIDAIPMNNTIHTQKPLTGKLVYVGLAGPKDVANANLEGAIAVAKRGVYYFSDKAWNVTKKGAIALIVFNNITDNFLGALKNPVPIPVVSISGEDGEIIVNSLQQDEITGNLSVTLDPYQVVSFSSRGPLSPFYFKPNIVAPGEDIITAYYLGGSATVSGTSFSSPHVAGAVALVKQVRPNLDPFQIMYLLMDNAMPLQMGAGKYPLDIQGAGLLQIYNTIASDFIVDPGYIVFHFSPMNQTDSTRTLRITPLSRANTNIVISKSWDGPQDIIMTLGEKKVINGSTYIAINARLNTTRFGTYYGWLTIGSENIVQKIPIKVQVNRVGISILEKGNNRVTFEVNLPTTVLTAKITILMNDGSTQTMYYKSGTRNITFAYQIEGEYWISVLAKTATELLEGFEILALGDVAKPPDIPGTITPGTLVLLIPYPALETIGLTLTAVVICMLSYFYSKRVPRTRPF